MSHSQITVTFYRDALTMDTIVAFRIPDTELILSRDPEEFMRWCYEEMMKIAHEARSYVPRVLDAPRSLKP